MSAGYFSPPSALASSVSASVGATSSPSSAAGAASVVGARRGHDRQDRVRRVQDLDAFRGDQFLDGDVLVDVQVGDIDFQMIRNRRREARDLDLPMHEIDHTAVEPDTFGRPDEMDRHLHVDGLRGIDTHEVDVNQPLADRIALQFTQHHGAAVFPVAQRQREDGVPSASQPQDLLDATGVDGHRECIEFHPVDVARDAPSRRAVGDRHSCRGPRAWPPRRRFSLLN